MNNAHNDTTRLMRALVEAGLGWAFTPEDLATLEAEERPRCAHGFARKEDGACRRCDVEATLALVEAHVTAAFGPEERVTQAPVANAPAKLTIGVTAGGKVARRSTYAVAQALGMPDSHEVRKGLREAGPEGIAQMLAQAGVEHEVVPASAL